ncbi:SNF1-related protein kinase regulatory subunit gamma-1 [Glycine soja]|uniref:SNF1-related protein kinase regulatory subunit gamma-1 n=1 Tax=Glycine soja TaxID=3848 RepID=A0A445KUH5_GLYSO|nr:SNF1-related protein kinase regulatory subunit gamma-1 [Glycine soja]
MQSRKIADVLKVSEGGLEDKKQKNRSSSLHKDDNQNQHVQIDSGFALQQFLDHIPIISIAGIKNSPAIVDMSDIRFSDRYIGLIDFTSMVLWCLENNGFFSILDQVPQIGQTKVSESAKSFLYEPFFPVSMDDTVLHALLLLSKHRVHVLPVIQEPEAGFIGFATQNAVVEHLLQSSELEWFDNIADKNLSDFRFESQENPSCVYGDQTVANALDMLWQNQTCPVAVVDRQTKKLLETDKVETERAIEHDHGVFLTAGSLRLKNSFIPRMDLPVANKENETLKQTMEHTTETVSAF